MRPKGQRQLKEDLESQGLQADAEAFIEKYRVKGGNTYDKVTRKVKLPVMWGGIPENCLLVRMLEIDGVKELVRSFLEGIHPMDLIGVIWQDPNPVDGGRLSIVYFQVDLESPKPPKRIHIVSGMHRTKALQTCHKSFPRKAAYMYLFLILLIVPRTQANIQTLLWIGNADNKKSQVVVKTTQWSVVLQYTRQLEEFDKDESMSPAEREAAFTAYKKRTAPQIGFEKNTLHTFSAISSVDSRVMALLMRIFAGEFVVSRELKGQKKPECVTHFTSMSGIPTEKICQWLKRILEGEWITRTFMHRCVYYRTRAKVADQVVEYISSLKPRANFSSILDVAVIYPVVVDPQWFDAVVGSCDTAVKAKLSVHAITMIQDMMDIQDKLHEEPKVCTVYDDVVVWSLLCVLSTVYFRVSATLIQLVLCVGY